jgi:pyroglutamyl-peptidase
MILISGFKPFKDFVTNPSEELVNAINIDGVSKIILPVEYKNSFDILKDEIDRLKPQKVFMFGLAQSREKISQEKKARNLNDCSLADNSGVIIQQGLINPNGETTLSTAMTLQQKENWEISEDAGTYVCNDLYYRTLEYAQKKHFQCLFIHIPLKSNFNLELEIKEYLLTHL